jgi:hypothetical protein
MFRKILTLAALPVVGALVAFGATATGVANAAVVPHAVHQDVNGLAGWYANNNGETFRDAMATFTVTPEMEQLNGTDTTGAVGDDLCNPNGAKVEADGLIWTESGGFQAVFAANATANSGGPNGDACVNGLGTLEPGGYSEACSDGAFGGNIANITINIGDEMSFETYFSRTNHYVRFTATDVTQDATSQCTFNVYSEFGENFYEPGVGVLDREAPNLQPPATLNNLVNFIYSAGAYTTRFTPTKGRPAHKLNGDLQPVNGLNALQNVVLQTSPLTNRSAFTITAGELLSSSS